jgi:hypothetical protein
MYGLKSKEEFGRNQLRRKLWETSKYGMELKIWVRIGSDGGTSWMTYIYPRSNMSERIIYAYMLQKNQNPLLPVFIIKTRNLKAQ